LNEISATGAKKLEAFFGITAMTPSAVDYDLRFCFNSFDGTLIKPKEKSTFIMLSHAQFHLAKEVRKSIRAEVTRDSSCG